MFVDATGTLAHILAHIFQYSQRPYSCKHTVSSVQSQKHASYDHVKYIGQRPPSYKLKVYHTLRLLHYCMPFVYDHVTCDLLLLIFKDDITLMLYIVLICFKLVD